MDKDRPRIALLVDHPQRDLDGLVLTAFELCQRGAICYLVPANLRNKEIWALSPDFVLMYSLRRSYQGFVEQLTRAGIPFGLLDAEGSVWPDFESYAELLMAPSLLAKTGCVCAWGEQMRTFKIEQDLFSRSQVHLTGCPRFDYYHPLWRPVLAKDGAVFTADRRPRILLNTNFTEANPSNGTVESMTRYLLEKDGWSLPRVTEWLEIQSRAIEGFIELATNLSKDFPSTLVVVRPHPFEGSDIYRQRLKGLPNVEINDSGPIQKQLFCAMAVIQRSCTTAIEATLAGVPVFSPQWIAPPEIIQMTEEVSVRSSTYEEMRLDIKKILAAEYDAPQQIQKAIDAIIRDWFHTIDGYSHKRVSDALFECLHSKPQVDKALCARYLYGLSGAVPKRPGELPSRLRHLLGLSPDWSFSHMKSVATRTWIDIGQYFGPEDVRSITGKISAIRDQNNIHTAPVAVALATERGGYLHNYSGHSVALSCESQGEKVTDPL